MSETFVGILDPMENYWIQMTTNVNILDSMRISLLVPYPTGSYANSTTLKQSKNQNLENPADDITGTELEGGGCCSNGLNHGS